MPESAISPEVRQDIPILDRKIVFPEIEDLKSEHESFKIQVVDVPFATRPGDGRVSTEIPLDIDPKDYNVITAGPHMWSQSVIVSPSSLIKLLPPAVNRVIGMRPYEESLEDIHDDYHEPSFNAGKKPPIEAGRSYGFLTLRRKTTGETLMIGAIPQLDTFERLSFSMQDGKFAVSIQKDFEGIATARESKFRVFLGFADPQKGKGKYADLLEMYGQELAKIKGDVPLLENQIIGFSYPAYGGEINQEIIEQEIEAGKGIINTYIIDAGWARPDDGFKIDTKKFPDLPGLAKKMREAGVKPGIWISPFETKRVTAPLKALKDESGNSARSKYRVRENYLGGLGGKLANPFINPESLDISIPQVREHLSQQVAKLAEMGFEVFKLDFLSAAFAGKMIGNEKTSAEYYRQTIQEIRETVRKQLGKEIILIGCGGPWMESLGLFNGIRMTPDSAYPQEGAAGSRLLKITGKDQELNAHLYRDSRAVAARRVLPFSKAFGMIFDGIHINPDTALGGKGKEISNRSLLAYRRLGISNMFAGDSFRNITDEIKQKWIKYIEFFKSGRLSKKGEDNKYEV